MSSPRPTRRASSRPRGGAVGDHKKSSGTLQVAFLGAVVAVILSFVILVSVATGAFSSGGDPTAVPATAATSTPTESAVKPTEGTSPVPSLTAEPTTTADGSIVLPCGDILAPLDKQHVLPASCAPADLVTVAGGNSLRAEAAGAFNEMLASAKQAGFTLYANSAYRSYAEQASTYQYWVSTQGKEYADRTSALPGHSEHQLGTTADVGARGLELENFIGTPEAAWLAANSYKFGFIVSYPDGKEDITGYAPEPWHVRYVTKDVAQKVHDSGLTLHEYLLK